MSDVEWVVSAQCELGEGPVWHPSEQVLYWLDIYGGCLHRLDPRSGGHQVTELHLVTSAMGVRAEGGFVMATRQGFAFWDPGTRHFEFIGDPDADEAEDVRFNDGKTDHQGRFWAGKMSGRPANGLYRLDPDRSIHRMESGIEVSNGLGWSPDNRTFYYTDSPARVIYAYDYAADSGAISNRRVFASIPVGEGLPDGLAVDEEGCIWSARWGGWKLVRYMPDGRVEREIPMPVAFPTSCAFGGPDLRDLYITSAWTEIIPGGRADQPLAGDVFRLRAPVKGFPEPLFQG
jgi:L-arabinonolactonase